MTSGIRGRPSLRIAFLKLRIARVRHINALSTLLRPLSRLTSALTRDVCGLLSLMNALLSLRSVRALDSLETVVRSYGLRCDIEVIAVAGSRTACEEGRPGPRTVGRSDLYPSRSRSGAVAKKWGCVAWSTPPIVRPR
jgi:hypothetical protein